MCRRSLSLLVAVKIVILLVVLGCSSGSGTEETGTPSATTPPVVAGTALACVLWYWTLRTSPHHTCWRRAPLHRRTAGPYPHCAAGQCCGDTFLDIVSLVQSGGEQGLLSVAFHPAYHLPAVPGFGLFWVNYTNTNGDTVIARYTVARANPQQADPASALTLFVIMQPFSNHNGGLNTFGPVEGPAGQRYLYIGMGDGGGGGIRGTTPSVTIPCWARCSASIRVLRPGPRCLFTLSRLIIPWPPLAYHLAPSGQKDCAIPGVLRSIR